MQTLRNVVIVLGIATGFSLLTALGGIAVTRFPHFVASDDRFGSFVVLHLITAIPAVLAAAVSGMIAAIVFQSPHHLYWSAAALTLAIVIYVMSYGRYWQSGSVQTEDVIGIVLAAVLMTGSYFAAHFMATRIERSRHAAG